MIAAIVQVRMASTRLPGKVLMEIKGKPLLSYLIEQLRCSKKIEKIIIATTTNKEDGPIIELCEQHGILFFRGSEADVLDRYYQAATRFKVDHIVRVTGDCPLLDPQICDNLIDFYFTGRADYAHTGESFAEGLDSEIFSYKVLEQSWKEAKIMSEREHVTPYIRNHPEKFKIIVLQHIKDYSKYRFTLDNPEDFEVCKFIIESLYSKENSFIPANLIIKYLDHHDQVFNLNSHIVRNEGYIKSLSLDKTVK